MQSLTQSLLFLVQLHPGLESNLINDPAFALDVYSNVASDFFRYGGLAEPFLITYHETLATLDGMKRDSKSFVSKHMLIRQ